MTVDELRKLLDDGRGKRSKPVQRERSIQEACVAWFRYNHPKYLCFAVPNGGFRNAIEAANMRRSGTLAGVSDLIVVLPHLILFVEMKAPKGRQSPRQQDFQQTVKRLGFEYHICYSLPEFQRLITTRLK